MNKNAIVTLADSNYFEMLIELIESIKRFPESKNVSICVLDAGLEKNQIEELNKRVFSIKKANWDIDLPFFKKKREWLKSQVSRAFLPNYFPDFEKYLWLDSDAWVNSWECVENYFKACNNDKLGITQTIGPGYKITSKVKWLMGKFALIKKIGARSAEDFSSLTWASFGKKTSEILKDIIDRNKNKY